jgi:hypothetical protein
MIVYTEGMGKILVKPPLVVIIMQPKAAFIRINHMFEPTPANKTVGPQQTLSFMKRGELKVSSGFSPVETNLLQV